MGTNALEGLLTMAMPDGDDDEKIKACDVVPTLADPHATPERFTIQ